MFSRVFGAALRGAVQCRVAATPPKLINFGVFEGKSLLQLFKPTLNLNRGISSVLSSGVSRSFVESSANSSGSLLRKNVETSVLHGYVPSRSVIKWTKSRGKRQTVKTVLRRFYRLNWGIWIRTKAGRHRRRWAKRGSNHNRSRQHVFCNSTQSWMLDKMVSPWWRKPKYWVDDPYEPYHKREEYWTTRRKPMP